MILKYQDVILICIVSNFVPKRFSKSLKNVEAMFVDGGRNVVFLLKLSLFCVLKIHQCNKDVDISWEEVKRSVKPPFIIITQRRVVITKKRN